MNVRIGHLSVEDAGEAFTIQRAAYVSEAQRYDTPPITPLLETLERV